MGIEAQDFLSRDTRAGCMLWWRLDASDSTHSYLAEVAEACGFPASCLPLPISAEAAFSRAVSKGPTHLSEDLGAWRGDRVKSEDLSILGIEDSKAKVGLIQKWAPQGSAHAWIACWRVFLTNEGLVWEEVSPASGADAVRAKVEAQYRRQRDVATAEEIRKAAQQALDDSSAVWVRSGLYFLPGEAGVALARSIAAWLNEAGGSEAGHIVMTNEENGPEARRCAVVGLQREVEALLTDVHKVVGNAKQGASLRQRLQEVEAIEHKLAVYGDLLTTAADGLKSNLGEARRLLDEAAKGLEKPVELEVEIGKRAMQGMVSALAAVRAAAEAHDPESLGEAVKTLRKFQGKANAGAFGDIWTRLRKQAQAAVDSGEDARFASILSVTREVVKVAGGALADDTLFESVIGKPLVEVLGSEPLEEEAPVPSEQGSPPESAPSSALTGGGADEGVLKFEEGVQHIVETLAAVAADVDAAEVKG